MQFSPPLDTLPVPGAILVRAYPRLHVGLLDLGDATLRRNGGAGFTIAGPCLEVAAEPCGLLEVVGVDQVDARARREVERALDAFQRVAGPLRARFTVVRALPQHVGLGAKTCLLLTLLQAAARMSENAPDRETLRLLTGRGGTSGIGVNSFFRGGFLTDGGHPASRGRAYGPSSTAPPRHVPPVLCRLDTPARWRFTLVVPRSSRISDAVEGGIFSANTPLPEAEVLRAIAIMYHGIVAAVATNDVGLLRTALHEFHSIGFKQRELAAQPASVRDLYLRLQGATRGAVGLSSMGPLLYVVSDAQDGDVPAVVERLARGHDCSFLGTYGPRNAGFDVENDFEAN